MFFPAFLASLSNPLSVTPVLALSRSPRKGLGPQADRSKGREGSAPYRGDLDRRRRFRNLRQDGLLPYLLPGDAHEFLRQVDPVPVPPRSQSGNYCAARSCHGVENVIHLLGENLDQLFDQPLQGTWRDGEVHSCSSEEVWE